jgi:ribosomal protein S6--L-glutamate ligase
MLVLSRNASLYSTSRIVLAARARGHEVTVIDPLDFQIVVSRGRPALYLSGALVGKADVVIPRIGATSELRARRGTAVRHDGVPSQPGCGHRAKPRQASRCGCSRRNIGVNHRSARSPAGLDAALVWSAGAAIVKLQQEHKASAR